MATAWLSLGSNQQPEANLRAAAAALRARFGAVRFSPVYRTRAVGFDGPDFLNAAAALDTELDPETLDAWLHALEDAQGRRRDVPRFSSRTLDVDLLLYDDKVLTGPGNLRLPRPELVEQAFVLRPMLDLAPSLRHPLLGKTLLQLWQESGETKKIPVEDVLEL
jgi:2-amino-4-hydroxy-6-hydroxymethyldihydropteridine diphosphokinase